MVDATWNLTHLDDDESDLTEISSDEEDVDLVPINEHEILGQAAPPRRTNSTVSSACEIPRKTTRLSTQEATQKSKARTKDKWPIPAVESRQTISFSASNLYALINKGMIELNPEYQRGIVWSEAKQSNFINSLYHRFHAPEIVFNVNYDPDTGSRLRTCMDGKQRLTSICNFFDGKIPLMPYLNAADAPGYARRKFWSKKNGTTRPLIPPHVMDNLETTPIACVEYTKLTPDLEREIFQRVQHGVPLTPSDRLPAINGPWADVVRGLRNRMNTTEGFEGYLDWGKARGKDFQALAQVVYLAVNGTSPKKAYPSSLRIETFLNSTDGKPSSAKGSISNTMDIFCRIARTPGINEPLTRNLSPLEFVVAAFLIFQQRSSLTDRQLSDAICRMRELAKRRIEDLKFSQPNFKVLSDFVLKTLPKLVNQLVRPEANEKPAAHTPYKRRESVVDRFKYHVNLDTETDSAVGESSPITRGEKASGKRKRATEDGDDDDPDWIVEAPATKSRTKKESLSPAKVDPLSKVANRQRVAESKARTTVKKSFQKSITRSPAITSSPPPIRASLKFDGQVGTPTIRPTPSMAVQQAGSPLTQSRSPTVLSESTPVGKPIPTRMKDLKILKIKTIGQDGGIPMPSPSMKFSGDNLSRSHQRQDQSHGRPKIPDDVQWPKAVGDVPSSSTIVVTRKPGSFSGKVSRNPPNVDSYPSSSTQHLNHHDSHRSGTQWTHPSTGARNVDQTRNRISSRASLQSPGPISSRGGIPSPLEDRY